MTPLFGPLASVGTQYGYPQPYDSTRAYPAAGALRPSWWREAEQFRLAKQNPPIGRPVSPAPPVRVLDSPTGVPSFGPPPPATLVGAQLTHPDHLFGPFARLAKKTTAYGPGMLGAAPFPNL